MSGNRRLILAAVGLVAVVAAFLIAHAGSSNSAPETTGNRLVQVKDGKPVGGVQTLTVKKNGTVDFRVAGAPPKTEIHVHGYDKKYVTDSSGNVAINFKATIDGEFVIELEDTGTQIVSLEVKT
jgi:FlaG/FlaF family flagellin (archaellin)